MYLGIDIGGTKTLVASLDDSGVIIERYRFLTTPSYETFIANLADNIDKLTTKNFTAAGVGVPGKVDREKGIGKIFGNLPWQNVPIKADINKIINCPVVIENDAKLAALSEAMLLKDKYNKVLFITISTGINIGLIYNQEIESDLADSEAGQMMLEHNGKIQTWEGFASGKAIVELFGKQIHDINDAESLEVIAHNITTGLINLLAVTQPEIVVIGGSVGSSYPKYAKYLKADLKRYENPLLPIPAIQEATRPDDAVLYGSYDLAKKLYG